MKEKWLKSINRFMFAPSKHSKVCSLHFRDEDIVQLCNRKGLSKNAIPTVSVRVPKVMLGTKCSKVYLLITVYIYKYINYNIVHRM